MVLIDLDLGAVISENLEVASSWGRRFLGLLGRKEYPDGNALLLEGCPSIHMFFMKFAIDVLFVDENLKVVKVVQELRPWRIADSPGAHSTIELPAGTARRLGIRTEHRLEIRK